MLIAHQPPGSQAESFLSASSVGTTIPNAAAQLNVTAPTVRSAVESLETLGIVREISGKQRDRIYLYDQYVRILDEGTEPVRG